jgi:hypothetical protein
MSNLISKNIPLPKRKNHQSRYNRLPFDKLDVGDSLLLEDMTLKTSCEYMSAYTIIQNAVNRNIVSRGIPGKFKVAIHKTNKIKQLRIWRVE